MPWEIRSNYGGCSGYAVVKLPDGSVSGCHTTRASARAQLRTLYASEPEAAQKDIITNQTTPNKYPDYIGPKKKKKIVSKMMEPGTFVEGDFAMGSVDDNVYVGQIVHIMTDGMLGIEGSKMTIMASPENPAILIRIFEQHEDGYWKETHLFTGFDSMTGSKIDPLPMKAEYFSMGGTEITGNENTRGTQQEFVDNMMDRIGKAEGVRVGEMVSWNSSGGRATGKVTRIIRNGKYNVPNSDFTITGTPDDPAVAIRVYRNGEPTDVVVGHKMSTLRRIGKSMTEEETSMLESDTAIKPDVPKDLSSIFSNPPTHAKRAKASGSTRINLNLFRDTK